MGLNLEKMQTCTVIPAEITNWLNWVIRIMWIAHKEKIHYNISTMEPIIKRRHKSFKFTKIYITDAIQGKIRIIVQLTVSKIIEFENLKIEWTDEPSVDFDVNGFLRMFKSRIAASFAPKLIKGITKMMKKFETKIPQLWHSEKSSLFKEFNLDNK